MSGDDKKASILEMAGLAGKPEAGRDPIRLMVEIAENDKLSPEDRALIIGFAQNRFKHRRRMAYICLIALVLGFLSLFVAAFMSCCEGKSVLSNIHQQKELFIWGGFFLTSIVGAYYGVSALRPSS